MGFTNPPPIQADFLEFAHDRNGKIISAKVSRAWLRWFADFQEEVEVGLTLAQLQSELAAQSGSLAATLATNNVESIGAATFGDDYKGEWSARTHNIGDVRSYQRRYYRNKAARTAANTVTPDNDSTGWELIGAAATISINMQPNIDAIGASLYGDSYKGKWAAGVHAVNEYRSHSGRYYRCKVARSASDTDDPSQDNTGWEAIGSSFSLEGDISTARQENIDAAARLVFGDDYKGKWAAGTFAVGDVAYDDATQKFYECDAARTASNTDRPSVDSANWSLIPSLKSNVLGSTGLARVKSQILNGSGTWVRPENVSQVRVLLVGGGGGGGGGGGKMQVRSHFGQGGGGGAGGEMVIAGVAVDGNIVVTIGSGGLGANGGTASSNQATSGAPSGQAGGTSSFGSLLAATGGGGGGGGKTSVNVNRAAQQLLSNLGGKGSAGISSVLGSQSPEGGHSGSEGQRLVGFSPGGGQASGGRGGGGGGGGPYGRGGDGGVLARPGGDGSAAPANSGGGGGGGGGYGPPGTSNYGNGGNGGNGGSGICIVFWTE